MTWWPSFLAGAAVAAVAWRLFELFTRRLPQRVFRGRARWVSLPATTAVVLGLAAAIGGRDGWLGGAFALAAGAFMLWRQWRPLGDVLWVHGKTRDLQDPKRHEATVVELGTFLERRHPRPGANRRAHEVHRSRVYWVAAVLLDSGVTSKAELLLERLAQHDLHAGERQRVVFQLTRCRLLKGDVAGARAALAAFPGPVADPMFRAVLAVLEAQVLVRDGDAAAALTLLDTVADRSMPPATRLYALAARAHAQAALGDDGPATETLRQLLDATDRRSAMRYLLGDGPAVRLAMRLDEKHSPFRV